MLVTARTTKKEPLPCCKATKPRTQEQRTQWKQSERMEPLFRRAYYALVHNLITGDMEKQVSAAVRMPNATPETMLSTMPFFNPDDPATFVIWNRFAEKLQTAYKEIIALTARTEIRRRGWGKQLKLDTIVQKAKTKVPPIIPSIPVNPAAAEFIRTRSLRLARELSSQTRQVVSDILADAFEEAIHPDGIVRQIKASVGLTRHMQDMVKRRVAAMQQGGFKQAAIDKERDKYTNQLRTRRAKAIARTETLDAQTVGLKDTWRKAQDEGLVPPNATKVWDSVIDERVSDICLELDGQEVGINEQFQSDIVGPLDRPPAHPNCRSTMRLRFPRS